MLRRLWWLAAIAGGIAASLGGIWLLLGNGIDEPPWYRMIPMIVLFATAGMLLPASGVLIVRDVWKVRRAALVDARDGVVEQFRADTLVASDDIRRADAQNAATEEEEVRSADVLPFSKQVLVLNGVPAPERRIAQVFESAPPPGPIARFALPADLLRNLRTAPTDGHLARRRLTDAETSEIVNTVRRARRPSWGLVAVVLWVGLGIVSTTKWIVDQGALWPLPGWTPVLAVVSVLVAFRLRVFIRDWQRSRHLDDDRHDGWLLVLHGQSSGPSPIEILPRSQLLWSVAETPSAWRMTKAGTVR